MCFRPIECLCLALLLATALVGCNARLFPTPDVYVPPTLAATPPPASLPPAAGTAPTPTPSCTNYLQFLTDLTIPDGTSVSPGAELDKRWQVKNTGTCNWEVGYTLRLIAGPEMGAPPVHPLYPARAGAEAVIRILYTAPAASGIYRSAWQAHTPDGAPFGEPIFIEIVVP